jgi:hypothetical protein
LIFKYQKINGKRPCTISIALQKNKRICRRPATEVSGHARYAFGFS